MRRTTMLVRAARASLLALLAVAVATGIAATSERAGAVRPEPALIEAPSCARRAKPSSFRRPPPAIRVSVPPTALLQVDARGAVVAVATNTGCAPRPTDDVFVIRSDGRVEPATAARVAGQRWVGDFTDAGVYQPQSSG